MTIFSFFDTFLFINICKLRLRGGMMQNRRNNTPRWQAMFQELITVRNEITAEAALHQTIIDIGRINELAALIARTTAVIGELQIFLSDPTPADLIFLESFQNALP